MKVWNAIWNTSNLDISLFTEPETDCNRIVQDWSPTEKCPFCDGLRVSTDDYSKKVSNKKNSHSVLKFIFKCHTGCILSIWYLKVDNRINDEKEEIWWKRRPWNIWKCTGKKKSGRIMKDNMKLLYYLRFSHFFKLFPVIKTCYNE